MKTRCLGCMEEYDGEFEVCPFCGYVQGTPAKEAYHITPGVVIKNRYLITTHGGLGSDRKSSWLRWIRNYLYRL